MVSDDIVNRLREGKGDDIVLFGMMYEAADEIERLRTHMDALLIDNVELMGKVATLQATIDGRFDSTSTTQAVRS